MGESAVVKMNEDGVMVLPIEVRKLLDADGEKVYLRLNDIEVAKRIEEEQSDNRNGQIDEDAPFVKRFEQAIRTGDPTHLKVREIRSNLNEVENPDLLKKAIELDDRDTAIEQYEKELSKVEK